MNKVPQILRRKIGSVVIIDLNGELVGPWAIKAKDTIAHLIENSTSDKFLVNLKDLMTVDSLGVKAIVENLPENKKSGFINGRISVMEMFSRLCDYKKLNLLNDENEVIDFFGEDFVKEGPTSPFPEQRAAIRLKTAVPLEFWYEDKEGDKITFRAIVTDLSLSGLFAEYLDVDSFSDFNKYLNPKEMKELHLKLKLPGHDYLYSKGIVVRTVITGEQVGIGVRMLNMPTEMKQAIKEFLGI